MSEFQEVQGTAPESAAQESDPLQGQPVAPDTTETVAETDEQKNQRELAERQKRSERASRGIQKRFDELTAEKHFYRQQAEQAMAIAASRLNQPTQQQPGQPDANAEPQRGNDEAYEDYVRRLARWDAKQAASSVVQQEREASQRQSAQSAVQQQAVAVRQDFEARSSKYVKDNPGYAEVFSNEDVHVPELVGALVHMPYFDGPAILHALHKNPALAAELQKYDGNVPALSAVLGRIDAQLKSPQQVSKAAPPGSPVGTRSGAQSKDVKSMTPDEYYAHITRKGK